MPHHRLLTAAAFLCAAVAASAQVFNAPGFVSPGPLHRAAFADGDDRLATLRAAGAVVREEDYGAFRFAVLDERPLGGREAFRALGVELRDFETVVGLNDAAFDTTDALSLRAVLDAIPAAMRLDEGMVGAAGEAGLWIVQFAGPVKDAWLDRMTATGAEIVHYVPSNSYVVSVRPEFRPAFEVFRQDRDVQWTGLYQPWWKLEPKLRATGFGPSVVRLVVQTLLNDGAELEAAFEAAGLRSFRESEDVLVYRNLHVWAPLEIVPVLAALPQVFAIELEPERKKNDERQNQIIAGNLNVAGTQPSAPGYLAWLLGKGFAAAGQFAFAVDITDDGVDRGSLTDVNDEFKVQGLAANASRVVYNNNYTSDALADGGDGHGNINASIAAGYNDLSTGAYVDGSGYRYGLGVAPFAQIGNTKVFDNNGNADFTSGTSTRLSSAYGGGARVSSNSWGAVGNNGYSSDTQTHDSRVRDAQTGVGGNQELSIVFAAGNDGAGANTVSAPATGKNVICVGASENYRQNGTDGCGYGNSSANSAQDVISFSSRGPCADGRIKPDLMAPGVHIQGAASRSLVYDGNGVCDQYEPAAQTLYAQSTGTSHSCPAVAGACALVRQYFINQGLGTPSPAMVKAALMTTASQLTGVSGGGNLPNNTQGMGLVNLGRAFDGETLTLVDQSATLGATGTTHVVSGGVVDVNQPFRVGLVWTDAAGATTGNAWVNNLDLTVVINGNTYRGNVFSGGNSTTGGTADAQNNAEFVFLPAGTTGSYTITVTAANIAGNGVPGNADTTDQDFALFVYNGSACTGPTVLTQPANVSVCSGGLAAFTVVASGAATYQWRKDTVNIGGATSPTYTDFSATAGDVGSYDCVLTAACGAQTTSNAATLSVNTAPAVTGQPTNATGCTGGTASFTVTATGGSLGYQWRKGGVNIGGATAATLNLSALSAGDVASYDCVVTNACGSVPSNAAFLTLNSPPAISTQPVSVAGCTGGSASFTVVATGTAPLTYQWRKNAVNIGGATSATYTINPLLATSGGTYSVVVTNGCGSVTSANATLTLTTPISVLFHPQGSTVCSGAVVTFSVIATGGVPITYQWRKNGANIGGATTASYALGAVTPASAGTYDCVLTNACGPVTTNPAVLTVNAVPTVTTPPASQTVCPGAPVSFSVAATGSASFTYQWRKNAANIGGATSPTYTIPAVAAGDVATYDCVVTNACGSTPSAGAALTLAAAPTITLHPTGGAVCGGQPFSFTANATGTAPLTFQWRKDAVAIPGATGTSYAIGAAAAGDSGTYDCVATNACGSATTSGAVFVAQTAPGLLSVAPNLIPIQTPTSPAIALTLTGSCFTPTSLVVANETALATTFVSSTTLTALLPPTIPQTQLRGGIAINVQNAVADVSNTLALVVGGGSNQGTIRRQPLMPNPGDLFQVKMEGGTPFMPLTALLDFGTVTPFYPFLDPAQDLVLSVTSLTGSAGPLFPLFDGIGLFLPPDGTAYDATGTFTTPAFALPLPLFGVTFTVQGLYLDLAAPNGFRLTWAKFPETI
jgi:hypothetical protein